MPEQSTSSHLVRWPQVLGRLGLYATYVAVALVLLVIAGDLDVLLRHAPVVVPLSLLVVAGPLVAMLLSTLASYVNYYGVWRILRGQDKYDAGQDLKSHAGDIPQALETLLLGRTGCLPAASTALPFVSRLLAAAPNVPPATPVIGVLGTWPDHVGTLASSALTPTPTPTALPTATATATATAVPTATATARPTAVPMATATPTPVIVIIFTVSPTTASWTGCVNGSPPPAQSLTLDNSHSTVAVSWQASAVEKLPSGAPWAVLTPASGTVPASNKRSTTVSPDPALCRFSSPNGTPWHVSIVAAGGGTSTFTYTVY